MARELVDVLEPAQEAPTGGRVLGDGRRRAAENLILGGVDGLGEAHEQRAVEPQAAGLLLLDQRLVEPEPPCESAFAF